MAGIFDEDVTGPPVPDTPPTQRVIIATPPAPPPGGNIFDEDVGGPPLVAPLVKGELDWSKYNQSFGELKPADPSYTQATKWGLQDVLQKAGMLPQHAQHISSGVVEVGKTINPIMGGILSGADAAYNAVRGRYGSAAWDALGALPGVLAGRRLVQGLRGTYPTTPMADTPLGKGDIAFLPERGAPDPYGMGPYGIRGPQPAPPPPNRQDELLQAARQQYRDTRYSPVEYHPNAMNDFTARAKQGLEHPELGFSPEKAPLVHATLDRWVDRMSRRNTPITAADWDTLRQQLRGFEGADGAAGGHVAGWIDRYMANPPPGALVRGSQADLDTLRANFDFARGNYRAGKTAETVEKQVDRAGTRAGGAYSGLNLDNTTRQALRSLTTTDAGEAKIFGARPDEIAAINQVVAGDRLTNQARLWGNRLGGGGGLGNTGIGILAGSAGTSAGHLMGMDPYTAMAFGTAAGVGTGKAGTALRGVANERTVRAAEDVVGQIRRNSPEYAARLRAAPPIADPFAMRRDAIAYALIPQVARQGRDIWDTAHVPYENREQQ